MGMSHSVNTLLKSLLSLFQNRYPFSRRWILFSIFSAHDSLPLAAYCIIQTALLQKTGVTYRGESEKPQKRSCCPGCLRPPGPRGRSGATPRTGRSALGAAGPRPRAAGRRSAGSPRQGEPRFCRQRLRDAREVERPAGAPAAPQAKPGVSSN